MDSERNNRNDSPAQRQQARENRKAAQSGERKIIRDKKLEGPNAPAE